MLNQIFEKKMCRILLKKENKNPLPISFNTFVRQTSLNILHSVGSFLSTKKDKTTNELYCTIRTIFIFTFSEMISLIANDEESLSILIQGIENDILENSKKMMIDNAQKLSSKKQKPCA